MGLFQFNFVAQAQRRMLCHRRNAWTLDDFHREKVFDSPRPSPDTPDTLQTRTATMQYYCDDLRHVLCVCVRRVFHLNPIHLFLFSIAAKNQKRSKTFRIVKD